jgi:hypothetical protein
MSDGVFWPEFEQWLRAHDIEPDDCSEIRVTWTPQSVHGAGSWEGPVHMVVDLWLRRDGFRYREDGTGKVASVTRTIPMRHLPAVEVIRYRAATGRAAPASP